MTIPWALALSAVVGATVLAVTIWWQNRKARQSAGELAEDLADSHEETVEARANESNRTAAEKGTARLNEAADKLDEKVKTDGSLSSFLRDRGAGRD